MNRVCLLLLALLVSTQALAQRVTLTVAAYPAVDDIVKSALAEWKKNHPNKEPPPYLVPSSMRKPFTKKMEQYAENIVPIKTKNEQGEPDIVSNKFLFFIV
jgi:hypothetical protein